MKTKVLFIGDSLNSLSPCLRRKGFEVLIAHSCESALDQAFAEKPNIVVLDTSSLKTDAKKLVSDLREEVEGIPVILIVPEARGKRQKEEFQPESLDLMKTFVSSLRHVTSVEKRHVTSVEKSQETSVEEIGANVVLHKPFTSRKLINRIKDLLPTENDDVIRYREITLFLKNRHVRKGRKEKKLTPKEFKLLELFMRNPGKVLTREFLMKEVWDTDYMGDTRTLDVHIHWVREKIEEDTSSPRYLRTVRGVGYLLVSPEEE